MTDAQVEQRYGGRFEDESEGLRERTARGTLVNAAFTVGLASLGFIRGFAVAAFLTAEEYGVWGILVIALGTITNLKLVGINDKFIQQDEEDQELAFQKAFTLDTLLNLVFLVVLLAAVPLMTLVYGEHELLAPGFVLCIGMLVASLQAPLWVYYRQMKFVKQRVLSAVDPIVSLVVTVALAAAGFGYWSLVAGTLAGLFSAGLVCYLNSPYPFAFRYDRGTLREYYSFSWPLFVSSGGALIVAQSSIFFGELSLGLAGAGAITLASSIALYSNRVDQIVTQSIYPAICAVKDRTDLLFESFVKSNRLALMWAMPFGVGLALFAPDLVDFVIGDQWEPAIGLLQAFGLITAFSQLGFNWTAFFRARGDTKPIAKVSVVNVIVFVCAAIPMLLAWGLDGFALGMAITTFVSIVQRTYYLASIFPGFGMIRHSIRAMAPAVPAAAAVLAVRLADDGARSSGQAILELVVFAVVTVVATIAFERALLREMIGYLRGGAGQAHQPA